MAHYPSQTTNATPATLAALESARLSACMNRIQNELFRREVASRLGLYMYISDEQQLEIPSMLPSPPPPPHRHANTPEALDLRRDWTAEQHLLPTTSSPFNPIHIAALLQASQVNNLDPSSQLANAVAALLLRSRLEQSLATSAGAFESQGPTSTATVVSSSTLEQKSRSPVSMVSLSDVETLSEYQCLLREQMDLFEASGDDVRATVQGRNKPIFFKQVGVQCKHCAHLPPKQRPRGAVYYPTRLASIYQSCQNMGVNHFNGRCPNIPATISINLDRLKNSKSILHGGGKKYWAEKAKDAGIVEVENGLEFELA